MKPKLPRALLWTDKNSIDDFLKESINMELYEYYMLIRNYTHFNPISNAVKLFNEIYYQLTKIEYEKNPYVDIKDLTQDIKANVGLLQNGVLVLNMMHIFLYLIDKKTSTFLSFERILRDYIAGLKSGENVFEYEQKLR